MTWHSSKGVKDESRNEIVSSLSKDVEGLNSSATKQTKSSYFYGKLIARAARLALIAEEVFFFDAIEKVRKSGSGIVGILLRCPRANVCIVVTICDIDALIKACLQL